MTKKCILRRLYEWDPVGPGKFMDWTTYPGCFRALCVSIFLTYVMWNSQEVFNWLRGLLGFSLLPIDAGRQSWTRLWTVIIGGTGILTSIAAPITLFIERRRARKSAIGQWYDRPDLTREELYGDSPELPEGEREVRSGMSKPEESKEPK
ncbi:hypothetical protein [Pseudothauera rhizosphaerae]|uniref:Uncharacterized protein n=1 Tax=Pseudothauera rhizosphaerae TaxID=2565932 RepID=A0A4S4A759_9RHOO|nr:hypothetical protein [Pseudothauera rhizosphaerae]THF54539.1 hypothetical protein E6O51_21615 [Pseudothauera rhizosphaerae]